MNRARPAAGQHVGDKLILKHSSLSDADLAVFRALCDRFVREKQMPTTPDGIPTTEGILDVVREAYARTVATRAEADAGADLQTSNIPIEEFLAIRKAAGLKIDPRTADVTWGYEQVLDPYRIYDDLSPEEDCVGRAYFARAPGSDIWVCFDDLPQETREALWKAHKHELAFPAGFPIKPSP